MKNKILLAGILSLAASPALAGEPCRPAKDLAKLGKAIYASQPELTDIITPKMSLHFKGVNGAETPTAILYRHEGVEDVLPIVDGELTKLETIANWSKEGEMCRMSGTELAPKTEENTVEAELSLKFLYKRSNGDFTIEEIREGAKDGSKIMKALAPGGLGFVVPGLKSLALKPAEGSEVQPNISFYKKGEAVAVDHTPFEDAMLFRLKDVKSAKADALKIEGAYTLEATFKFDPKELAEVEAKRLHLAFVRAAGVRAQILRDG